MKALERIREDYPVEPFSLPATVLLSDEFCRTVQPAWHLKTIVRQPGAGASCRGSTASFYCRRTSMWSPPRSSSALDAAVGSSARA